LDRVCGCNQFRGGHLGVDFHARDWPVYKGTVGVLMILAGLGLTGCLQPEAAGAIMSNCG
jgi:hypothetical protein